MSHAAPPPAKPSSGRGDVRRADLHPLDGGSALQRRRERTFLVFAGLFLGSMTMLNILGISRFIKLAEVGAGDDALVFAVAVGVLPYPLTFLCTDFISEFWGRARANWVVLVGVALNAWVVFVLWLGGWLPGFEQLAADGAMVRDAAGRLPVFYEIRELAFGAVIASMFAYLAAQLCDVYVFHFWKRLTRGKHLWLRNNGSTLVSQLVDSTAVILITHYGTDNGLPMAEGVSEGEQLAVYIFTGYAFKAAVAALDTVPFYLGVKWLTRWLEFDPIAHEAAEQAAAEGSR